MRNKKKEGLSQKQLALVILDRDLPDPGRENPEYSARLEEENQSLRLAAKDLAAGLGLPLWIPQEEPPLPGGSSAPSWRNRLQETGQLALCYTPKGLIFTDGLLDLSCDFTAMSRRSRPGNLQQEMLLKAVRKKGSAGFLRIADATAGLGEDAFVLAAAGHQVWMFEKDPVIAALLQDGLKRCGSLTDIVSRLVLQEEDSLQALPLLEPRPDVVYLDPMFPKRKKSAQVKKKFQLLHYLERPCGEEQGLLDAAWAARPGKIVIKRPAKGPYLAGRKPDYSLQGKAIRYDVILSQSSP